MRRPLFIGRRGRQVPDAPRSNFVPGPLAAPPPPPLVLTSCQIVTSCRAPRVRPRKHDARLAPAYRPRTIIGDGCGARAPRREVFFGPGPDSQSSGSGRLSVSDLRRRFFSTRSVSDGISLIMRPSGA